MEKYKENHLLFFHGTRVPANNNAAGETERGWPGDIKDAIMDKKRRAAGNCQRAVPKSLRADRNLQLTIKAAVECFL